MRKHVAALATLLILLGGAARAQEPQIAPPDSDPCEVPGYLLFGEASLDRVQKAVKEGAPLNILVLGTLSAVLPGPDGAAKAFPGRLGADLRRRLPDVKVHLVNKCQGTAHRRRYGAGIGKDRQGREGGCW